MNFRLTRKEKSLKPCGHPAALWLLDMESGATQGDVINEILVHEQLADWNMRDIARFAKQQGETIIANKADLKPVDLVLDIFEQLDNCGKGLKETPLDCEKDEAKSMKDCKTRSKGQMKIITIDDSSDDEDVFSMINLAPAPTTTTATTTPTEMSKCCKEDIYYGPPPPVASHAVALSYSKYGGALVVQVGSVNQQ